MTRGKKEALTVPQKREIIQSMCAHSIAEMLTLEQREQILTYLSPREAYEYECPDTVL